MTADELVAEVREIATDDAAARRAERIAAAIRERGDRRWVGVYEVTDAEVAMLGYAGPSAPAGTDEADAAP